MANFLVFYRDEFRDALAEEIRDRLGHTGIQPSSEEMHKAAGYIHINHACIETIESGPLNSPLIFERQRMENAEFIPAASLKAMSREVIARILPRISASKNPWVLHVFSAGDETSKSQISACRSLESVFFAMCKDRFTPVARRRIDNIPDKSHGVLVLQLCMIPQGLWGCVMPVGRLSDTSCGGEHRMAFDSLAPSRSYLKIEEAFDVMGEQPVAGQSAVDLGAAPGGWTWALLKRGCHVIAVDNGPLKLLAPGARGAKLVHEKSDGISYTLQRARLPLDWLVSDMLVSAGTDIGMLRKWIENRWMRRFIINIKLPQKHPYEAVKPLEDYLKSCKSVQCIIRQLYHDRREVTVMGRIGR